MVDVSRIRITGPIVPFAAGFAAELQGLGYTEVSARAQLWLAAHLSTWMAERDLAVSALDTGTIAEFVAWRRASGRTAFRSAKALEPLLCYLRKVGAAPQPAPPELPAGPVEVLLEGVRGYLRAERGVSGKTAQDYAAAVRPLLDELADAERVRVEAATAEGVSEFILGQCRIRNVRVAQLMVTATRALLRYLHLHGMVDGCLVAAVPKVPDRRQQLPRGLEPAQVQAMLDACDHSPAGRRDYAILVVLARLGLRAGEAARLCLEDIDWQRGQLTVRGKPRRVDVLPLPVDVGQALAGYLRWGRPAEALTGRCSFGLWPRTAG